MIFPLSINRRNGHSRNTDISIALTIATFLFLSQHGSCAITHTWDFSSTMPEKLVMSLSMSWFGIPSSDPQGGGSDKSYGNWQWGGGCVKENDPRSCSSYDGSQQRNIASLRRPLAGIYSSSGRDAESLARVDLMLSTLRRPCDDGAKIDAWAVQIDSIKFSSRYPHNPLSEAADLAYRALLSFYERANKANMKGKVLPAMDATWYFHFGKSFGLGHCNETHGDTNLKQACIDAIEDDIVDMILIATQNPSNLLVNGKSVLVIYTDASSEYASVSEWNTLLQNARNKADKDFYVVGTTMNSEFFACFDALAPWVNLGVWQASTGATIYDRAYKWITVEHASLLSNVQKFPGRVVLGGVAPGFDDYTMDWGNCKARVIPRDPALLNATFDFLKANKIKGLVMQTWDDWTEGSHFEPDVEGGPSLLLHLRHSIEKLFNETPDENGDNRLVSRWNSYGRLRNCNGTGHIGPIPETNLICPTF